MQRVLLIGAGTMGSVHFNAYQQMDHVQVAGVVDPQVGKTKELGLDESRIFESWEIAVEQAGKFDVIDVCVPTIYHLEYVKKAAELGKHVICEKPLARHLKDALEMIDYCKQKQVRLFVGHVVRFFPEYEKTKKLVENDEVGQVGVVRMRRGGVFPTGWEDWYADFDQSGGLILDMIIHDFDYIRWTFGEVERIYAKGFTNRSYGRSDYALVTMRMKAGPIIHVEGSWTHEGFSSAFEIAGSKGIIDFDSAEEKPLNLVLKQTENTSGGVAVPESPLNENPYFRELRHFMRCVETGENPRVTPYDALKAMEISLAALRSMETGEPVVLSEYDGGLSE